MRKNDKCGSDSKKLFQLVNHLTSCKPEDPLLTSNTDQELVYEYSNFFVSKILKISNELDKHPLYQPSMVNVPEFNQLSKLNEEQLRKLIMNTESKSCELDPIQTTLLKNILPSIIAINTNIINQSLRSGSFLRNWKTAIVRPLIKKKAWHGLVTDLKAIYLIKIGGEGNVGPDQPNTVMPIISYHQITNLHIGSTENAK